MRLSETLLAVDIFMNAVVRAVEYSLRQDETLSANALTLTDDVL
jgi:hypothetical protein